MTPTRPSALWHSYPTLSVTQGCPRVVPHLVLLQGQGFPGTSKHNGCRAMVSAGCRKNSETTQLPEEREAPQFWGCLLACNLAALRAGQTAGHNTCEWGLSPYRIHMPVALLESPQVCIGQERTGDTFCSHLALLPGRQRASSD